MASDLKIEMATKEGLAKNLADCEERVASLRSQLGKILGFVDANRQPRAKRGGMSSAVNGLGAKVIAALGDGAEKTVADVAAIVGHDPTHTNIALAHLARAGKIARVTRGVYKAA